jgi:eukaryotic-like serine/threonine-protein kinase
MSTPPEQLAAALSGRYRIERELGEGGMATVYLADDLKHERKVALKVLKPELAAVVGAERFLAEIKTTANLQHPHILPLFDSGEADGFLFYVMPFVDGETLGDRLQREQQLPVDEAVRIAKGVASALEYAHEQDVVHRDIKPANILMNRGEPLVADFGIALALSQAGGGRITETGLSLGTPHYMSPEQAAGQQVDARSDVYALGCVLFELLTGEPPHAGANAQVVLSKILTGEARRVTEVRRKVPPNVDAAVARALEKLPADRTPSASEFIQSLDDPTFRYGEAQASGAVGSSASGIRRWRLATFALAATATALAISLGQARSRAAPPPSVFRASVAMPESEGVLLPQIGAALTLSSDGNRLAYVGPSPSSPWQLWLRPADALGAELIRGTEATFTPKFSPDGQRLAVVRPNGTLLVSDLQNGSSRTFAENAVGLMDWSREGNLYYYVANPSRQGSELWKLSASGGEPKQVWLPENDLNRGGLVLMGDVLPGENGMLITRFPVDRSGGVVAFVMAVDLETNTARELTQGFHPRYIDAGYLTWGTAEGTLMVAPFDPESMRFTGEAVRVLEGVLVDVIGVMHYAVSRETGSLVYRSLGEGSQGTGLLWVERDGTTTAASALKLNLSLGLWDAVDLSPDGKQAVAGSTDSSGSHLWVQSMVDDSPPQRVTYRGTMNVRPRWSPSGDALTFISDMGGNRRTELWTKPADGTGTAEPLVVADVEIEEGLISPDGEWVVYRTGGTVANRDIMAIRPGIDSVGRVLVATDASERSPRLSPDGRFLAYISDELGRDEIFVITFPDPSGGKWQVSRDGGKGPIWAHNGSEIFYVDATNQMMTVTYTAAGGAFRSLETQQLFSAGRMLSGTNTTAYDISPDDQRFLMISAQPGGGGELVWVRNWTQELAELTGGGG